jgi:hypothetical protein
VDQNDWRSVNFISSERVAQTPADVYWLAVVTSQLAAEELISRSQNVVVERPAQMASAREAGHGKMQTQARTLNPSGSLHHYECPE